MSRRVLLIVLGVIVAVACVPFIAKAQRSANPRWPLFVPGSSRDARSAQRQEIGLTADPESDEVIPGMKLVTEADGRTSVHWRGQHQLVGEADSFESHSFVAVDHHANTYRAFKLRGPHNEDPRVRAYVRTRFGLNWERAQVAQQSLISEPR